MWISKSEYKALKDRLEYTEQRLLNYADTIDKLRSENLQLRFDLADLAKPTVKQAAKEEMYNVTIHLCPSIQQKYTLAATSSEEAQSTAIDDFLENNVHLKLNDIKFISIEKV